MITSCPLLIQPISQKALTIKKKLVGMPNLSPTHTATDPRMSMPKGTINLKGGEKSILNDLQLQKCTLDDVKWLDKSMVTGANYGGKKIKSTLG
ncbi:hypothetical protein TNIN_156531 [Trichonephila inaurata madagascariensis]|uniref:Uncharacterized protein n=1 Tax=Trichonephila inaurata madagascariensis TaxID=2747483 RepID=A0A8X7BTU0_9ARAC|nr:hypothetical protein TNIN_156531 [Trichonephila inaurata madagascariensis]